MKMLRLLGATLCAFLLLSPVASAQEEENDWKLFRPVQQENEAPKQDSATGSKTIRPEVRFGGKEGQVQVFKDSRIDKLTEFSGTPQAGRNTVTLKGFRIQAFFDQDKNQVNQKRAEYLARFDSQPAYIDFLAPNFRLRIGDFRTKLDAQCYLDKIKILFPDAIIVQDDIELPVL